MHPSIDRPAWRHAFLVLLVSLPLLAHVATPRAATAPRVENPHGKFREDCQLCHNARAWKEVRVSPKFDHSKYGFPLTGAHATSNCMSCHASLEFSQSKTMCASCHADPHRGEMGTDCARCHGARSFVDRAPMVRAHLMTRFPLTGSHAALDCEGCHQPAAQGQMQFAGTPLECRSCHMDQYRSTRNPDHVAGGYPTECQTCHAEVAWTSAKFNHDQTTFPLTGAHRSTACARCHTTSDFKGTRTACAGCHQADYDRAQPPHAAAGFAAAACATCHNTTSFANSAFDHSATQFPLTGAHASVACANCHGDGVYVGKSTACFSCHATNYAAATPPHTPASFPTAACATCHSTTAWTTTFNHNTSTSFPLTGAHASVTCANCHGDGVYAGKSTACYSCHASTYASASPPHTPNAFPTAQCATCHNTTAWSGGLFNHTTNTTFPLTGMHNTLACVNCHGDGVYAGKSTDCYSCHATNYAAATPPHTPASFPTAACATCHSTTAWTTTFNHNTSTSFPLTGAHVSVTCANCHGDGVYAGKSTACYSCHASTYASASPPHTASAFPTAQCATCHNTTAWSGGLFNHTTNTTFPLTGVHNTITCANCHGDGVYAGKSTDCYSCHAANYAGATNPPHSPAAFPTSTASCTGCHNTTAWQPSTFSHANTAFALTGAHPAVACTGCHNASTWAVPGKDCSSCHMADYNGTTNPVHTANGFPTTGCVCHTTATWAGATAFDHTAGGFPLAGLHAVPPRNCVDCHVSGYVATSTACISCHQTSSPGYNTGPPAHGGVNATFFPPTSCTTCHSTAANGLTTWAGGTFANHTWFPITSGNHNVPCMSCHTVSADLSQFSCSVACHQSAVANHDPKTTSCGTFSPSTAATMCYCCHPSGRAG